VQTPDATAAGVPGVPPEAAIGRGAAQPPKRAADGLEGARSGDGFRAALRRSRSSFGGASADPSGPEAGSAAGCKFELDRVCGRLSGAPREAGAAPAATAIDRSASASRAAAVARVLLGAAGGDVAEARIRIGGEGPAGAEIRLAAARDGRTVEAHLLTAADGSRETLAVMLDEIRMRLRARGVVLRAWPDGRSRRDPGSQPRPRDDR
jgi:hypothetical protein